MIDHHLYPEIEPFKTERLAVTGGHRIYIAQYGNPEGEPLAMIHGGPGAPYSDKAMRFFNPRRYRILVQHQRGCGESEPLFQTANNTTPDLIDDIEAMRDHLGITGPMHMYGGSWGSLLLLAYAIAHPKNVASIIVRGVMLCRAKDLHDAYQRNANISPDDYTGAAMHFPRAWHEFVEHIPADERDDMIDAYYRRIHGKGDFDKDARLKAAQHWCKWENAAITLEPKIGEALEKTVKEKDKLWTSALLETHYFKHKVFLEDGHLLKKAHRIAHIPIHVIQGRYDMVTPRKMADTFLRTLNEERKKIGLDPIDPFITVAGHTMTDEDTAHALMRTAELLPRIANTITKKKAA